MSYEEVKSSDFEVHNECPLKQWTAHMEQITQLTKVDHLKAPYSALIDKLRQQEVNSETDRYEFLKVHPHCGEADGSCC